jgi:ankyrin repeat protein
MPSRSNSTTPSRCCLARGAEIPDILVASCAGREDLVRDFLKKDRTQVSSRTRWGETPIHLAATYNHVKVAEVLLAHSADVNLSDSDTKITPLHRAAFCSGNEMITLLLKHKADPTVKDRYGKTPIEVAEYRKDAEIIRLLKDAR